MTADTDVTIIGAGPYGLSIAAHLKEAGADFRIVGLSMQAWLENMPKGMLLKSAGLSSTLYDPAKAFALPKFCSEHGITYADAGIPVALQTFQNYGLAFQKRMVPSLQQTRVTDLRQVGEAFELRLEDGSSFTSRRVIVAVGLENFRNMPGELAGLPVDVCSHSSCVSDPGRFRGKDVIVVGAGSSAVDIAVLLQQAGAKATLVARRKALSFNEEERMPRPIIARMLKPMSGVGIGWGNKLTADVLPWIFPYLPTRFRRSYLARTLGPAAGWFMKEPARHIVQYFGCRALQAQEESGRVRLQFRKNDGEIVELHADHVVAATGYVPDVKRVPFVAANLVAKIRLIGTAPRLSPHFESSVPNLYFVGPVAAASFGPIMRFSLGAGFTARRISSANAARSPPTASATTKTKRP